MAKGGIGGIGALATPILALVMSPVAAAAVLLPLLISQDIISVWAFRRSWNRTIVGWMLPGALAGVFSGWALATWLSVGGVMAALGGISVLFGAYRLYVDNRAKPPLPSTLPDWLGIPFGWLAGFTSQIAHAGGPPFQMWVLPKRLAPVEFAGTSAVLFTLINWAKVPAYLALGQFHRDTLLLSLAMLPVATVSTLVVVRIIRHLQGRIFYAMVNILQIGRAHV